MSEEKVSVNLNIDSPYAENNKRLKRFRRRLTHRFAIKMIKYHCGKTSGLRVFDIGAGSGSFLAELQRKFKKPVLKGVEYDPRLVLLANSNFPNDLIFQGNAESFYISEPASWDVVTSFQVIEHVYNPELLIANAHKLLKEGGLFLVTSPNLNCVSRIVHGVEWQGFRFDHVNLKSAHDWNEIISCAGFEKIFVGTTFFSGLKLCKFFPFNILNGCLSFFLGAVNWECGESFYGIYVKRTNKYK